MKPFLPLLILLPLLFWVGCEDKEKEEERDTIYGTWELLERNMIKADPPDWALFEKFYNFRSFMNIETNKIIYYYIYKTQIGPFYNDLHEDAPCVEIFENCDWDLNDDKATQLGTAGGIDGLYLQEDGDLIYITESGTYLHKYQRVTLPDLGIYCDDPRLCD